MSRRVDEPRRPPAKRPRPPQYAKVDQYGFVRGECRVCGCTDDKACAGGCSWANETQTLCDNPICLTAEVWQHALFKIAAKYDGGQIPPPYPEALCRWMRDTAVIAINGKGGAR